MAIVVTPAVNSDGQFIGADVTPRSEGLWKGSENDYVVDQQGQTHHVMENVTIEEDQPGGWNYDEYISDIVSITPGLNAALAWAGSGGVDREWAQEFNASVEAQDLQGLNEKLDTLMNLYQAAATQPDKDDVPQEDNSENLSEWYDQIDDSTLDGLTDQLFEMELGESEAAAMEQAAENFAPDSAEAAILQAGIDISNGLSSVEEALQDICDQYGEPAALSAYLRLVQVLN